VFEYSGVSVAAVLDEVPDVPVRGLPAAQLDARRSTGGSTLDELRQRVQRMQGGASGRRLPGLTPELDLATGATYATDSAGLALALLAGPSSAGEWVGVVGAPDLGYEAAAALGVDLERTIVVPHPGEHWMSVVAALVDVASVVLVRPSVAVGEHPAERLRARLRTKDAALVCWGEWPRCQARFRVRESVWSGLGRGHGHLSSRRLVVEVGRTGSPRQTFGLDLPARGGVEPVRRTFPEGLDERTAPLAAGGYR
jgi:hypothetical protein